MRIIQLLFIVVLLIYLGSGMTQAQESAEACKQKIEELEKSFDAFVQDREKAEKENTGIKFKTDAPSLIQKIIENAKQVNLKHPSSSGNSGTPDPPFEIEKLTNLLADLKTEVAASTTVKEPLKKKQQDIKEEFKNLNKILNSVINLNSTKTDKNSVTRKPEEKSQFNTNWLILLGVLLFFCFSIILCWVLFRKISDVKDSVGRIQNKLENLSNSVSSQQANFTNSITNCENSILRLRNSLPPDLTDEVSTLKAQIQSLRVRDGNSPAIVRNSEPVSSELTVSNYLTQAAGRMVRVNSVFMRPETLTQDADGKFVLMQNQRGQHLAIPNLPRFGSAQDYSHFQKFYDCDQPAAGEIIIVEPAIVNQDPASGEWNLAKKGTLQISSR